MSIENGMILGSPLYGPSSKQHKPVGRCEGCGEAIYDDECYWALSDGEMIHDEYECKFGYLEMRGVRKNA